MVDVYTARIDYRGKDGLDITRAACDPIGVHFAPSAELLWPYIAKRKAGRLTAADWPEYAAAYTAEMRASYRCHRDVWRGILARESVTLLCYCARADECHRVLLARIFQKLGARYLGDVQRIRR